MTIIYHPQLATQLKYYGIDIPLCDDRSVRVFKRLQEDFPILREFDLENLPKIDRKDLELAHVDDFLDEWFNDELFAEQMLVAYDCNDPSRYRPEIAKAPLTDLRESILSQVAATCYAVEQSLDHGFCYYLGGGMHHARSNTGAGFCPVNDIVIAIRKAQIQRKINKVLILDVDAHMGDGTAEVTANDSSITTVSLHMADGWPIHSELPIIRSDYDLAFKRGEEDQYLLRLQNQLFIMEEDDWDLVFVVNGADPYEKDELKSSEGLKLSKEQLLARDMLIYTWAKKQQLPQTWVMAGGYGEAAANIYSQFILKVLHLMG